MAQPQKDLVILYTQLPHLTFEQIANLPLDKIKDVLARDITAIFGNEPFESYVGRNYFAKKFSGASHLELDATLTTRVSRAFPESRYCTVNISLDYVPTPGPFSLGDLSSNPQDYPVGRYFKKGSIHFGYSWPDFNGSDFESIGGSYDLSYVEISPAIIGMDKTKNPDDPNYFTRINFARNEVWWGPLFSKDEKHMRTILSFVHAASNIGSPSPFVPNELYHKGSKILIL